MIESDCSSILGAKLVTVKSTYREKVDHVELTFQTDGDQKFKLTFRADSLSATLQEVAYLQRQQLLNMMLSVASKDLSPQEAADRVFEQLDSLG